MSVFDVVMAAMTGNIDALRQCVENARRKSRHPVSAETNNNEIVLDYGGAALIVAARRGHTECVAELLGLVNAQEQNSMALRYAAEEGHTECVRMLIPHSDVQANQNEALAAAAGNGHTQCVQLLIDAGSDANDRNGLALVMAVKNKAYSCVELLLPHTDLQQALCSLGTHCGEDSEEFLWLHARLQHETISNALTPTHPNVPPGNNNKTSKM